MNYLRSFLPGSEETEEKKFVEGRLYDMMDNRQWRCLFNDSSCTITSIQNRDAVLFKRILAEGERIEKGEKERYTFILGGGMEFEEDNNTPCSNPGFSFFASTAEGEKMRFLFEMTSPEIISQIEMYEELLGFIIKFNRTQEMPIEEEEEEEEEEIICELSESEEDPVNVKEEENVCDDNSDEIICLLSDEEEDETEIEVAGKGNPLFNIMHCSFYTLDFPIKEIEGSQVPGRLYQYSESSGGYKDRGNISLKIVSKSRYTFVLCLLKGDEIFFHHSLNSQQHFAFVEADTSVEWIGRCDDNSVWGMKATLSSDHFKAFRSQFTICEWEMKANSPFTSLREDDRHFILNSVGGQSSLDTDIMDSYSFVEDSEEEEEGDGEDEEEEEEEEDDGAGSNLQGREKNSGLAVGFVSDRAFVARGNKIGVFKITENNQLEYKTTIDNLHNPSDSSIFSAPSQMMLHQQDNKMLMLNKDNKNSIFCMDTNRGEIVEEWKTSDIGYNVKSILPESRLAQLDDIQTFVGVNAAGAFRIDPRMKTQEKQVDQFGFRYQRSTQPSFSCAATTQRGDLLMGSAKGDVRLFNSTQLTKKNMADQMKTKAKNQLRLAGDPVIGVDVTMGGEWVLATCQNYLMIIHVNVNGVDGFEKSLTGDNRKAGLRLELSRDHLWEMGGQVSFTVAHFNRGYDGAEKSIVTSTGPYVVTWDFQNVIKGNLREYQIKQYSDQIVDEQFKFGEDKAIVVTLPDDVKIAKRKVTRRSAKRTNK